MQPDLLVVDLNCAGVEADADRAEVGSDRRHRNAARDSTFQRLRHKLVSVLSLGIQLLGSCTSVSNEQKLGCRRIAHPVSGQVLGNVRLDMH